jgi:hypothetical protein
MEENVPNLPLLWPCLRNLYGGLTTAKLIHQSPPPFLVTSQLGSIVLTREGLASEAVANFASGGIKPKDTLLQGK